MPAILSFLAGPSGKSSTMRVLTCVVVCAVMGTWSWISVSNGAMQKMDPEIALMVLGSLGIKAAQRATEGKEAQKETAP